MKATAIPPDQETSKQRSLRIVLNYHRLSGALVWSKYTWTVISLFCAAAYVGWLIVGHESAVTQLSPAPLASAHATLNAKCADCHTPFVAANPDGQGVNLVSSQFGIPAHPQITDANCGKCHQSEFRNPHHSNQIKAEIASCAACHVDHRGSAANLSRPDDKVCTVCHQSLASHREPSPIVPPIQNVSSFAFSRQKDSPHPAFRSLPSVDKNNFRFNHRLHMLPGQWSRGSTASDESEERRAGPWTVEKLAEDVPPEIRARYSAISETDRRVQLSCASCHEPESGEPATQSGEYMLPIQFERHCQACHPLQVMNDNQDVLNVRHGLKQAEIREVLLGFLLEPKRNSETQAKPRFSPTHPLPAPIPIPGKTPGNNIAQNMQNPAQAANWQAKLLNDTCLKCHVKDAEADQDTLPGSFQTLVGFARPKLPQRWLQHARFNHRAHLSWADCRDCHAGAFSNNGQAGKPELDDDQVLIPNIEHCVKCHAPTSTHPTFRTTARFDCAECHRYHAGAH